MRIIELLATGPEVYPPSRESLLAPYTDPTTTPAAVLANLTTAANGGYPIAAQLSVCRIGGIDLSPILHGCISGGVPVAGAASLVTPGINALGQLVRRSVASDLELILYFDDELTGFGPLRNQFYDQLLVGLRSGFPGPFRLAIWAQNAAPLTVAFWGPTAAVCPPNTLIDCVFTDFASEYNPGGQPGYDYSYFDTTHGRRWGYVCAYVRNIQALAAAGQRPAVMLSDPLPSSLTNTNSSYFLKLWALYSCLGCKYALIFNVQGRGSSDPFNPENPPWVGSPNSASSLSRAFLHSRLVDSPLPSGLPVTVSTDYIQIGATRFTPADFGITT